MSKIVKVFEVIDRNYDILVPNGTTEDEVQELLMAGAVEPFGAVEDSIRSRETEEGTEEDV